MTSENKEKLKEYEKIINNFKKFNYNFHKYDNMNSLTLKSEYSEEYSEMMRDSHLEEMLSPRGLKEIRKNREENSKHNETLENLLLGLNKEEKPSTIKNNIQIKNVKPIKNKRLNSDDIDDLNFSDNKGAVGTGGGTVNSKKTISMPPGNNII